MKIYVCIITILMFTPTTPSSALSTPQQPQNKNNAPKISDDDKDATQPPDQPSIPRLLPSDPNNVDKSIPVIQLGESIAMVELGPIIINVDGTTRRIGNWDDMTEGEQKVAWRRIKKRNEERRIVLEAALQKQQISEDE